MKRFRMILSFGVLCAFLFLLPSTARAQVPQTFVSANGKDTNECNSPDKPCRSISAAITKVQGGGEVVVISSGSYQPFAVNKAVTVVAPAGVHAGITVSSGDGAAINTPPSDDVVLRGLTFNGMGGLTGIHYFAGGGLHVENCVINGFSSGIFFGSGGRLYVKDTVTKNNAGSGIYIGSSSGTVTALVDGSRFEKQWQWCFLRSGRKCTGYHS
jgi:Right handed beta helix region